MNTSLNRELVAIKHKFLDHKIGPETETLVIGTFNPGHECNKAVDFFMAEREIGFGHFYRRHVDTKKI